VAPVREARGWPASARPPRTHHCGPKSEPTARVLQRTAIVAGTGVRIVLVGSALGREEVPEVAVAHADQAVCTWVGESVHGCHWVGRPVAPSAHWPPGAGHLRCTRGNILRTRGGDSRGLARRDFQGGDVRDWTWEAPRTAESNVDPRPGGEGSQSAQSDNDLLLLLSSFSSLPLPSFPSLFSSLSFFIWSTFGTIIDNVQTKILL
jgi:hypothetical protein